MSRDARDGDQTHQFHQFHQSGFFSMGFCSVLGLVLASRVIAGCFGCSLPPRGAEFWRPKSPIRSSRGRLMFPCTVRVCEAPIVRWQHFNPVATTEGIRRVSLHPKNEPRGLSGGSDLQTGSENIRRAFSFQNDSKRRNDSIRRVSVQSSHTDTVGFEA